MSSGSESDDDYAPEENPVQLSEEESADDETEKQYENEVELKKKRKLAAKPESKGKKKRKSRNCEETVVDEPEEKPVEEELDPEAQKKKDDDLWAMFLDGTDTKPKPKQSTIDSPKPVIKSKAVAQEAKKCDASEREKRIFEFAGEKIVVENNVIKEKIKSDESPSTVKPLVRASTGGLSSLIGQIDKKNKLSTLEKSKLDWTTFKKDEGIEEEISSHNKGKQGYLERQDFLERADYRQYELERDLRMGRRSKR